MTAAAFTDDITQRLAAQFVAARSSGVLLKTADAAGVPISDADAYRVQSAVTQLLGRKAKAWKVGAANPTSMPNGAPIYDVHAAGIPVPRVASTGVELELAFKLKRDFPAAAIAPSRADVEAAIGAAHIALETCAVRIAEGMAAPALLRLADNGINLGLVIGPQVEAWRSIDASKLVARVEADGKVIAETTGGHTSPDLVALLTWLVGHCVTTRGGIDAGTIVTTGSWMGIRFVEGPAHVRGTFPGLGTIDVKLS